MIARRDIFRACVWSIVGTFAASLLLVLAVLLAGCGGQQAAGPATFVPRPNSSLTLADALHDAEAWVKRAPTRRTWAHVADTGSMEPFINEHSIVLIERTAPTTRYLNGEPLVFNRGDRPRVLHVLSDQTASHAYFSGFNNRDSDGWFPKTAIEGRVVGQLYLARGN